MSTRSEPVKIKDQKGDIICQRFLEQFPRSDLDRLEIGETYAERFVTLENGAALVVDNNLELLHALSAASQQRGEQFVKLLADRQDAPFERDFGVLDICDAGWGAWHESVTQTLELGEWPG